MKIKKIFAILIITISLFGLTGCSNTSTEVKDDRRLDYFVGEFQKAYTTSEPERPILTYVEAQDGRVFWIENHIVKIYQYKDEDAYNKAVKDNYQVKNMPRNGLFVLDTDTIKYDNFFIDIK